MKKRAKKIILTVAAIVIVVGAASYALGKIGDKHLASLADLHEKEDANKNTEVAYMTYYQYVNDEGRELWTESTIPPGKEFSYTGNFEDREVDETTNWISPDQVPKGYSIIESATRTVIDDIAVTEEIESDEWIRTGSYKVNKNESAYLYSEWVYDVSQLPEGYVPFECEEVSTGFFENGTFYSYYTYWVKGRKLAVFENDGKVYCYERKREYVKAARDSNE
ncbi:MAG: hypothetical protein FWG53_07455 [Clostridiales bacterium]|nr:hypothetical protein [Clostridiales bacterium]